nr:MAG TPA: hypothetical protein [Caudoviricetes sp.]
MHFVLKIDILVVDKIQVRNQNTFLHLRIVLQK